MQIDVIVPTYNRAAVVCNAVDSILVQTYKNFEIYIVDDGSNDQTLKALEKYNSHSNIHILSQANSGVSSARNLAVSKSKNEWISFLDSDDVWLPNKLEVQVDFLSKYPHLRFLNNDEIWVRNGVRVNPKTKHLKSNDNIFQRSLDFCIISPSTVMMKRDLFLECGGFDESFIVCEDYDLWLKILSFEEIGFCNEHVTIKHGGHEDQLSTQFVAMDYWRIKSLVRLYKNQPSLNEEQKEQIKNVLMKKSKILLSGYLKHQKLDAFDEIKGMLNSISIPVEY